MKKLINIFIVALLLIASSASGADVEYKGLQHQVAWDVSLYDDGTPCASCLYRIYLKNKATGVESMVGESTQLMATITIPASGSYWAGVDAVDGALSTGISWSNVPEVVASGQTFFLTWTKTIQAPKGIKHQ